MDWSLLFSSYADVFGSLQVILMTFIGAAGGVLAGLLFRKMPAKALHLILGGVILAGGLRLIVC